MPELPEVETVRRGLAPHMEGAAIASVELRRPDLRFPFPERFAERLTGRAVTALGRRAKYLVAYMSDGATLAMHLGMTGRFTIEVPNGIADVPGSFVYAAGDAAIHDHVVFHLETGARIRFNDARRFGYMALIEAGGMDMHPLFAGLGVEPLGSDFDAAYLARRAATKKSPLKSFLLDQRVIAGLGNIYVCEALFRARLHPLRPASVLATKAGRATAAADRLTVAIRDVLEAAITAGGSSLRDYRQADGSPGYFQHDFAVYGREGGACNLGCGYTVNRVVIGGRSTFFCPACQR